MTRYWQSVWGSVTDTPRPSEGWTEVKVVPLDAIVIDRSELPEDVEIGPDGWARVGEINALPGRMSPPEMRRHGVAYLALAEHLTAHPPVDEAQVAALTDVLGDPGIRYGCKYDPADVARRLIATGKVQVTS